MAKPEAAPSVALVGNPGVRTSASCGPGTATHCPYCSLQCGMQLTSGASGVEVAARAFPTNKGDLCVKGWTAGELLTHPERLTTPLQRSSSCEELRPCSWDDALSRVSAEIVRAQDHSGRDAVGVFGGGGLTNEKAYLLGKFARVVLRTANVDYNGRFCMSSAATAANQAFGIDRGILPAGRRRRCRHHPARRHQRGRDHASCHAALRRAAASGWKARGGRPPAHADRRGR